MVTNPQRQLSDLPLLTAVEQYQLLVEWNNTGTTYPRDKCLHQLFEEQVERTPEAIAIVFEDQQLTYRELNRRANQLAHYIQNLGVGPEVLVGICMERSLEMVLGLLSILKAGGAYVPLDPEYPKQRLAFMLQDTQVSVLLTQQRLATGFPEHAARVVCLDVEYDAITKESAGNPVSGATADNLAYMIYTSGSTGRPKGAMNIHRGICNRLLWMQVGYQLTRADSVLQKTPFTFDVSLWEFFWPLLVGARLVMARPGGHQDSGYLAKLIAEQQITTIHFVPSMLRIFLERQGLETCNCLKRVICSGEALPFELQERFFASLDAALHNLYGPTEASVDVTSWACKRGSDQRIVPIGRPIANTQIYLLDSHLQPVPVGVPGELHIGGVSLGRGYLNRPELTAEKFIPNSFSEEPGARLYRTGDLARYLPDGNIEFLGRVDHQVKIRGFRIEPGEIEAVLGSHPAVRQSVVSVRDDIRREKGLVAHVVPEQGSMPTIHDLRGFLKEKLPDYMVPSVFVFLESLPLTPNGKLDRRALPAPDPHRSELAGDYVEPRTVTERLLAGIWAEVLGIARIGANDDFFALGGHSLRVTSVIVRILDMFGVELSHRCFFEAPTLTALAERIDRSQPRPPEQPLRIDREPTAPLSWGQTDIWVTAQLEPSIPVYNEPFTLYMNGPIDPAALEEALNEIIRRHEILRTAFTIRGDHPVQLIQDEVRLTLSVADVGSLAEADRAGEAIQRATAEAQRPFDLAAPPLVRATLVRLSAADWRLYLTLHHIVADAYSIYDVLVPELWQLYESLRARKPSRLREPSVQYADYARWQRRRLRAAGLEPCLTYWKRQLDGALPLELPTNKPRPSVRTFRGAYQSFALSKALTDALNSLSRRQGVTLYMVLLAAFKALLWRYTQQDEIVVGTAEAGRNRPEFEPLLGYFLNILVLRSPMADDPTFQQFLQRIREVTLEAYAHRDLPLAMLLEELQPKRDPARHPLFQAAFVMEPTMPAHESGWRVSQFDIQTGTAKFELTLELEERAEGILGRFEYNTDLFDDETVGRMIEHLRALLEGIVSAPHERISKLPWLTKAAPCVAPLASNHEQNDCLKEACIHQLFEAQVEARPNAVAVIDGDVQITYCQLNERANQLAHHLRALGTAPNRPVAVCMDRSADLIVSFLAVLKAGGAYVPLDPEYPPERLRFMMKDTGVPIIVADGDRTAELAIPEAVVIRLDTDGGAIHARSSTNPSHSNRAQDLAYVMYTSGSTGQPKGVEISHRGVVRLVFGIDDVTVDERQRFLLLSPISFDASTFELWEPLLHGGTCVIYPQRLPELHELERILKKHRIRCLWLTAALFNLVMDQRPEALASVSHLVIGGEALSVPHVRRALQQLPNTRVINGYGPTENTTFTCTYAIPRNFDLAVRSIPIGRPIADTRVYILDKHLKPVPDTVAGELYIGGDGLARGYRNRPELTAEKFIPSPFSDEPGARLYKTGDMARYLPDGNIEFLGRTDEQVKIRGHRIELKEIETVLADHPGVRQSVAMVREDEPGDPSAPLRTEKRLVAYVMAMQGFAPTTSDLRGFLKGKLPEYMVPSTFVMLDALPLNPNGKVDRKALPALDQTRPELKESFVAPRHPAERTVAEIWAQVLKVDRVGVHDNFFDLGGHSLLASQVVSRLREAFHVEVPLRLLFENPTVAGLAVQIAHAQAKRTIAEELVDVLEDLESLSDEDAMRLIAQERTSQEG